MQVCHFSSILDLSRHIIFSTALPVESKLTFFNLLLWIFAGKMLLAGETLLLPKSQYLVGT